MPKAALAPVCISPDTRRLAERAWHDEHFERNRLREIPGAVKKRYSQHRKFPLFPREALFSLAGNVYRKRVLVFGCGDDALAHLLAWMGGDVTAFDISTSAMRAQREIGLANGTTVRLAQAAAEALPFQDETFDLIIGTAILHHLPDDLAGIPQELRRILRSGGKALFIEPINRSATLAAIRRRVPVHTQLSPGERQLTERELCLFQDAHRYYFRLLARLDRFTLPNGSLESAAPWRRAATRLLCACDRALLAIPPMRYFAGTVLLQIQKPDC